MYNKKNSKLTPPTTYDGYDFKEKLEQAMDCFYNSFLKAEVKPEYNNKKIFFNMNKKHGNFTLPFPERFLHIVSIDDEEKFNVDPCTNDIAKEICDNQCENESQLAFFRALKRWECPYRLHRIHWIKELFKLANNNDKDITEWDVQEKSISGSSKKRLIRYSCGVDDYVIVLREQDKRYNFLTAYPVVSKRKKREFDNAYNRNKK